MCREISKAKDPSSPTFFRVSQCQENFPSVCQERIRSVVTQPFSEGTLHPPQLRVPLMKFDTGTGNKPHRGLQGGRNHHCDWWCTVHGGTSRGIQGKGGAAWRRPIRMLSPIFPHRDDNKDLILNCNRKRSQFLTLLDFRECFTLLRFFYR